MNDAESACSPSRFWSRFGARSAVEKTSACGPTPNAAPSHRLPREAGEAAGEDAGADGERAASARRALRLAVHRRAQGFFASQAVARGRTIADSGSSPFATASAFSYHSFACARSRLRA